jgi:hypothetical protein
MRGWGFPVEERTVEEAIRRPEELLLGYGTRFIAQIALDERHLLRVIYEEHGEAVLIVTLYPARRSRYEN